MALSPIEMGHKTIVRRVIPSHFLHSLKDRSSLPLLMLSYATFTVTIPNK